MENVNNKKHNGSKNFTKKKFNKNPNGKSNYGFKSIIKLKKVDTRAYGESALESYLHRSPTDDELTTFRENILGNYHLYEILVSADNHFTSGYSYRHVGWVAISKEEPCVTGNAVNATIWFNPDFMYTSDRTRDIVYVNTAKLVQQTMTSTNHPVRIIVGTDYYKNNYKAFGPIWRIDARSDVFKDILGDETKMVINKPEDAKFVTPNDITSDVTILIASNTGISCNIGNGIDLGLKDYIMTEYNLSVKFVPYKGIKLYTDSGDIVAVIDKCNSQHAINATVFTSTGIKTEVIESIINYGIDIENKTHKNQYDKTDEITINYKFI